MDGPCRAVARSSEACSRVLPVVDTTGEAIEVTMIVQSGTTRSEVVSAVVGCE